MNEFLAGLARIALRALLLLAGVLFFVSLLAAALVLAVLWSLRTLWCRLTGRPVTPWSAALRQRMDPRQGWRTVYAASRWTAPAAPPTGDAGERPSGPRLPGSRGASADVTDVTARDVP